MFIEKIQRIFKTSRLNAVLLEVFAIFLGISASFAVEEWRQGRQDREEFERYLAAIYFDTLREEATSRRFVFRSAQTVAAIHKLMSTPADQLTDAEVMNLMGQVFRNWSLPRQDGSYRALLASGNSAPFDETLQILSSSYEMNANARNELDVFSAEHNQMVGVLRSRYGAASNPVMIVVDEDQTWGGGNRFDQPAYRGIRSLFFSGDEFLPAAGAVEMARTALAEPETAQLLREVLERTMTAMDSAIDLAQTSLTIREAIREQLPELRLAIRKLRLVGDVNTGDWTIARGAPLLRESESSDWWGAELDLSDGQAKLVANDVWGTSWGAPINWDRVDPLLDDRAFNGNPDEVFPRGIAEFDGINIPVKAGRYRVRFNTHTFEYSFERIDG